MNIINIAQAASNSIVSCSGSDCSLCSLLETVSNGYNFFLGVCLAVAVLALIIAGVGYLISSGDKFRLQKSTYFLKSVIGGFALILVGWLIVQTVVRTAGFTNAGNWWSFECNDGTEKVVETGRASSQSEYYKNLKTFPDLLSYYASGDKTAKITGPLDATILLSQMKALKDGEVLHFLAPARVDATNGAEDLFLPLLTVLKEGDSLELQSTGEYWDLLQNEWAGVKDQVGDSELKDLLNKYLGADSYTDNRALITDDGSTITASNNQELSSLYKNLAQLLQENATSGDRTSASLDESLAGNESLSELLAILASSEGSSQEQTEKIMSILTSETMKLADIMMVNTETTGEIFGTDKTHCVGSGGEWSEDDNICQCQSGYQLQDNGYCQSEKDLEENCGKSGGDWTKASEGLTFPKLCGSNISSWNDIISGSDRANASDITSGRYYCQCYDGSCIDSKGKCRDESKDDDGDGVANDLDRCPGTPAADKKMINETKGSQYYGCSCYEIGTVSKECPPDQCVGDNWVDYPSGEKQECEDGKLLSFTCKPTERSFDETCSEKNLADSGTEEWNGNTNSWDSKTNNWNGNTNAWAQSPYNNSSANKSTGVGNKSSGLASKSPSRANSGNKKISDDKLGDPRKPGEGGIASTNDHGNPAGVKASLKRIYEKDKLRYLMIFKYVNYIEQSGGGGITWSHRGGVIGVNFGQPLKYLDQIIIHETTHRADFAWDGWSMNLANAESIAVANQIGSVGRIKESPGQKEEVKVTLNEGKDQEARGYNCRWLDRDINPRGDMNPSDIGFAVWYAKSNGGGTTGSNFVYGYPPSGERFILRVSDFQENRVKTIMDRSNERKCISRPSDDLPQLTEENGYKEEQLKGCKEAKVIRIGG